MFEALAPVEKYDSIRTFPAEERNFMKQQITVLMALYNGGEYLKLTVQSVLNQTHPNFEFLIVNDCSTDNSLEIIRSFHDERIKIYNNPRNLGQAKSLNVGLRLAKGDYIARIDADDIALPQWLETQLHCIEAHPDCSVISAYVFAIDERNKIKKLYKPPLGREDIILRSLIASPINHVGSIFRKKDIVQNGGYDEQYMIAADYDLWGKLLKNNFRITTTPKMLMAIREHTRSLSRLEGGKREFEEIKEVISKNIIHFVSMKFSDDEVRLFCRANYDGGNLTTDEFRKAIAVTRKVYTNLGPSLKIKHGKKIQWTRHRCLTIYLKRIFSLIEHKDYTAVRHLSLEAIKEFGPFSIFIMFFGASLFDGMILAFILELYNKILRRKACFQLGDPSGTGMFH